MIPLLSGAVSASGEAFAKKIGHDVSLILTAVLLIGLAFYTYRGRSKRSGTSWQVNGPTILCCVAIPLILADLTRHVLQDYGVWPEKGWWSSAQFAGDCGNLTCLSVVGVLFTIIFTYTGFACMLWGSLWNADICGKVKLLRKKWRKLRGKPKNKDVQYNAV